MRLIVFGTSNFAKAVILQIRRYTDIHVIAMTVDEPEAIAWEDIPIIPFSQIPDKFPPNPTVQMLVLLGYQKTSQLREEKYLLAKELGYSFPTLRLGVSYIAVDAQVGENTIFLPGAIVDAGAVIGNNVMASKVNIGHNTTVEDHCFLAGGCLIGGETTIGRNSFLGLGSIVRDKVSIGRHCVIGAGVVMLRSCGDYEVYRAAQPLRITKKSTEITI